MLIKELQIKERKRKPVKETNGFCLAITNRLSILAHIVLGTKSPFTIRVSIHELPCIVCRGGESRPFYAVADALFSGTFAAFSWCETTKIALRHVY